MPDTIKTVFSTPISIFELNENEEPIGTVDGDNAIVQGTMEDIVGWLGQFDTIWVGNGIPQSESFHKDSIKKELIKDDKTKS